MSLDNITVKDKDGNDVNLGIYKKQIILIINTATGCGFTPQYKGLESLYEKYRKQSFVILDFPCNQFANQAPGTAEDISNFCTLNYNTQFPQFAKIDVNGENESPLYTFLKSKKRGMFGSSIKWNFTKFLIDKNGNVVKRYGPEKKPENIEADIISLL